MINFQNTCFHLLDRNQRTLQNKIQEFIALKGKPNKLVSDNEFNILTIRNFLQQKGIQYHATKPNSHTGNSDIERLNNTLTEKIRTLNLEEKLPITTQINKAVTLYNSTGLKRSLSSQVVSGTMRSVRARLLGVIVRC